MSSLNKKFQLAAAVLAASVLSAGCGMMAPRTERYVAPTVGTTYASLRRDTGSYGSATVQLPGKYLGEQMWQGQKVRAFESPELTIVATTGDKADFIAQVRGDTPILTWNPPVGWEYPLEVGKTWTKKTTIALHAAKRTIPLEYTQKVEAYENVTVPAGTFRAVRVSTVNSAGDENMQWFAPGLGVFVKQSLRRTDRHAAGPGTREIELISYNRGN